jgi:hypothetical protein
MPDPLHLEPHPESERSPYELREQFRAENLDRIRSLLKDYRVNGVNMKMMGQPLAALGGTTPAKRAGLLLAALDESVEQDFNLGSAPLELIHKLGDIAADCEEFEKVTWPDGVGAVDHDGPPAPIPVEMMTDAEQCAYVDRAIEESKKNG